MNLTFEESSVTYSEDSGGGSVCIEATGPPFIRSIPILVTFENGTAYGECCINLNVSIKAKQMNFICSFYSGFDLFCSL